MKLPLTVLILAISLSACGGGGGGGSNNPTYVVSANVTGLQGTGLVLTNPGSGNVPVSSNGPVTIVSGLSAGMTYAVVVSAQPTNPWQTCTVTNGTGTIGASNVSNVAVSCATNTYSVGGTVSGLNAGGLALSLNGGSNLPVSGNGAFTFPSALTSGSQYSVAVAAQPAGANCGVSNGTGTVQGGPVNNVTVACTATSGGQVIATPGPPNVEPLVVDTGPTQLTSSAVNIAFVTVTVCMPGTNTCQNIDHIQVDTGSIGLRIIAGPPTGQSAGELTLALPAVADPKNAAHVLGECLQFADGWSWGSVNLADVAFPVSGEKATNVIVHVIGAPSAGDAASANPSCVPPPPLVTENTVPAFGANGILGVGPFVNDCNSTAACAPGSSATYYTCASSGTPGCTQTTVPLDHQLPNPAVLLAKDNNGVIVELPPIGTSGAAGPVNGSLVFGIGTEGNNALGTATKLPSDPASGVISATLNGTVYPNSYLDSGSNANFFPTSIPSCPKPNDGFLCPASTTAENATLMGTDTTQLAAPFSVANANTLFMNNYAAFSNLAGNNPTASSLDLGLAFFYGRNMFTGFENPGVTPPFFAY